MYPLNICNSNLLLVSEQQQFSCTKSGKVKIPGRLSYKHQAVSYFKLHSILCAFKGYCMGSRWQIQSYLHSEMILKLFACFLACRVYTFDIHYLPLKQVVLQLQLRQDHLYLDRVTQSATASHYSVSNSCMCVVTTRATLKQVSLSSPDLFFWLLGATFMT